MSRFRHLRKAPKKSPKVPDGLFMPAAYYVLYVAGDPAGDRVFGDILDACQAQRTYDPLTTWIVRKPDGAVLKVRNGSSADLRRLVQRHGGHL